jgi:hypothetical protein
MCEFCQIQPSVCFVQTRYEKRHLCAACRERYEIHPRQENCDPEADARPQNVAETSFQEIPMEFSKAFSGKYWKSSDLPKPQLVTITGFAEEPMMGNSADMNKSLYGDNSDACIGKQIVLCKAQTEMQGRTVDCIRVRAPKAQQPFPEDAPY